MIACPILDDKKVLGSLPQDIEQKGGIAVRVEPSRLGFIEEAPGERVDEPKDLVGFADATRWDCGLVTLARPGIAQGALLGKAGLIAKQQQGLALAGLAEHRGPRVLTPLEPGGLVEMRRDKARFLVGQAQVV